MTCEVVSSQPADCKAQERKGEEEGGHTVSPFSTSLLEAGAVLAADIAGSLQGDPQTDPTHSDAHTRCMGQKNTSQRHLTFRAMIAAAI
jgi:hypothetical protein